MNRTMVILAAGKGTRVAKLTNGKNKCLIDLGSRTAAEYILDHTTESDNIIFVLNEEDTYTEKYIRYKTNNKNLMFVYTNRQGGPGDSLYAAKNLLNRPFILWYCDTILDEGLPTDLTNNFIICSTQFQENYKNYMIVPDNEIVIDKSSNKPTGDNLFYIGLSYIKDADLFWKLFDENEDEFKKLCDIAFMNHIKNFNKYITNKWYDVGNISSYEFAKATFDTN